MPEDAPRSQFLSESGRLIVIVVAIVAVAATAIVSIFKFSYGSDSTSASTTVKVARPTTPSAVTSTAPSLSTTSLPPTTLPPTTTVVPTVAQIITYGSATGSVVWQSGDAVPTNGGSTYEGYYCCKPPFPDGVNRSGSAGCSGNGGSNGTFVGGYFLNGALC